MPFAEPVTVLTDLLVSLFAAWFAYRLFRQRPSHVGGRYWAWAMSFTAVAAVLAGMYHGLRLVWPPGIIALLDYATVVCMSAVSFFVIVGTSASCVRPSVQVWFVRAALVVAMFFSGLGLFIADYVYIVLDYGSAFLVVAALCVWRWREKSSRWLFAGVGVSAIGALVQMARLAPAPWFNHNDLYHIIQIVSLYLFYRGAILLKRN